MLSKSWQNKDFWIVSQLTILLLSTQKRRPLRGNESCDAAPLESEMKRERSENGHDVGPLKFSQFTFLSDYKYDWMLMLLA